MAPVGEDGVVAPEVVRLVMVVVTAVVGWQLLRVPVLENYQLLNRSLRILRQPTCARYAHLCSGSVTIDHKKSRQISEGCGARYQSDTFTQSNLLQTRV